MKILQINCETGEQIERDATDEELVANQLSQAAEVERQEAEATKAAKRQALLEKLGITEEEAKLLLS